MARLLDFTRHEAVERDHLPRVASYDDDSQHVLYWDGVVRSLTAAEWLAQRGPLPADPTPEQIAAALAARTQERQQEAADTQALRQALRTRLQSAVGVQVDDLLVGQLRALVAYLLWREGALDADLRVRPLSEWEARR